MTPFYSSHKHLNANHSKWKNKAGILPLFVSKAECIISSLEIVLNYGIKRWDANTNIQCNLQHATTLLLLQSFTKVVVLYFH